MILKEFPVEKYLPEVKRAIAASMAANMAQTPNDKQFLKKELKKIRKVNPLVAEFIVKYASTRKGTAHAIYCGVMVYKLLYSQSEADHMNKAHGFE
jgi:hypothetical protein